jgi:molybdopterin/thiamine biosynthesis adenylyltransferase/proteasome lid subunit RPN8/RPN11
MTFLEDDFGRLGDHLFNGRVVERAAYLLCRPSLTAGETRYLVRAVVPVAETDTILATQYEMKISSGSYVRALKEASRQNCAFFFVHSHPLGDPKPSRRDDREDRALLTSASFRIAGDVPHGSLVFSNETSFSGRVLTADGTFAPIDRTRVIGERFRFFGTAKGAPLPQYFERQILAFGDENQRQLRNLHIGVVGVGGTGSSVVEQLVRLGVGKLTIIDDDDMASGNVSRVYGSRVSDEGTPKVSVADRLSREIGLGTVVQAILGRVTAEKTCQALKDCDVVFGCTDDHWGRSVLTKFAIEYLVPVIDMGVAIEPKDGLIDRVEGRVTTLLPGGACLFCRRRIDPSAITAESLRSFDAALADRLTDEDYLPALKTENPSVVFLTTAIAASAVSEFMHRLTGYLGADRVSNETLHLFDRSMISTSRRPGDAECFCGNQNSWGIGDRTPFLGLIWPS